MRWTLDQIADATGGTADRAADTAVTGVSIDSRSIQPGELFVAVRAERDGHDFAEAAVAAGAAALLVERATGAAVPEVVVGDTAAALLKLGRAARGRLDIPVVGITGSVGKTSTKDMAAAALQAGVKTVASPRSFNNELGLPLTLANAPGDAQVVVLEMGARGPGHIALLCSVAQPRIGIVTAVAAAHTEMFGDLDGVARAKGELIQALPPEGTAVLNADDRRTAAMVELTEARRLLYSAGGDARADVVAQDIRIDDQLHPTFRMLSPWGSTEVRLEARGGHQVGNALAALSAAALVGVDLPDAAEALQHASLSPHRMEVLRTPGGAVVLNDAYNANPASMAAALQALAHLPVTRRIAVLGYMAELGERSAAEHRAVGEAAAGLGIELIAVGTHDYGVAPASTDEVVERLDGIGPDTAVLVKASRVAALEKVAALLTQPPAG